MSHTPARITGQAMLFDAEQAPYPVDIERRNSLARTLQADYLGIDPAEYDDVTASMLDHASAESLRPSLVGVRARSDNAVTVTTAPTDRRTVALTPFEYTLIPRSPDSLGRAALNRTLAARVSGPDFSAQQSAAERSRKHALEGKFEKMGGYYQRVLTPRAELLGFFAEAARHPGLSRGVEGTMRLQFEQLRSGVLSDALVAIRHQRQWTPEQAELAERAIVKSIVLDRSGNRHISNFKRLVSLLTEHNALKMEAFRTRGQEIKAYLESHDS